MAGNYDVAISIKALDEFSATFQKLQKQLSDAIKKSEKTESAFAKMSAKFKSFGKSMSLRVTAPITAMGGYMLKQVNEFSEARKKIFLTTHDMGKMQEMMEGVNEVFKTTNNSLEDLSDSAGTFIGMGASIPKATEMLKVFAAVAGGSHISFKELSDVILRGYIGAKKTKEGFIPSMVAKELGTKLPDINYQLEKMGKGLSSRFAQGKLSVEKFNEALSMVGKNAAPDNIADNLSKIHHTFQVITWDIAEVIFKSDELNKKGEDIVEKFSNMEVKFKEFINKYPQAIKYTAIFAASLAVIAPLILLCSSTIGLIALGISALVVGTVYLYNKFEFVRDIVKEIWMTIKNMWNTLKAVINAIGTAYTKTKEVIAPAFAPPPAEMTGYKSPYSLGNFGVQATLQKHQLLNQSNVKITVDDKSEKGIVKKVEVKNPNQTNNFRLGTGNYLSRALEMAHLPVI